jgi:triosephosphate isomerase (TIM)
MSKILIFNWKMNPESPEKAHNLFESYLESVPHNTTWGQIVICPPDIYISSLSYQQTKARSQCDFGSQNVVENPWWIKGGAFTGEISATMYQNIGCKYVIIGHSERRCNLHEQDSEIQHKVESVLETSLTPVICVGYMPKKDTPQIDTDDTEILTLQVKRAMLPYKKYVDEGKSYTYPVIAYEPVWAIGTGEIPTIDHIVEVCSHIRESMRLMFGDDFATKTSVLYGGSVNEKNISDLRNINGVDGFLIGGAGLKPDSVTEIITLK